MALFDLHTGACDAVVRGLRWEWEIPVPELGLSMFEVPRQAVKGGVRARILVCNSVVQSIIESGSRPAPGVRVCLQQASEKTQAGANADDEQHRLAELAARLRAGPACP